jgi:hypothetical protein
VRDYDTIPGGDIGDTTPVNSILVTADPSEHDEVNDFVDRKN